jgi:hypothetical protein
MQKTDGLFLQCCDEVAAKYPEIYYEKVVIDNCCMMVSYNMISTLSFVPNYVKVNLIVN